MPIITPEEKRKEAAAKMRKYLDEQYARNPKLKEQVDRFKANAKKRRQYTPPASIESLEQWEEYQKWEDRQRASHQTDTLLEEFTNMLNAKKGPAIEQPLNYNHPSPFDELDKALGNNPDSTSGKDKKKNRFEHLEIETDGTDNSEGDSGAPTKQP